MRKSIAIAICALGAIAPAHAEPATANWQIAYSGYFSPAQSGGGKLDFIYAPHTALTEDGWRFRFTGRLGTWRTAAPVAAHRHVLENDITAYAGYRTRSGALTAEIYAGPTAFSDNEFGFTTRYGASALASALWSFDNAAFVSAEMKLSTLDTNWSFSARGGYPVGWQGVKLGPEISYAANTDGGAAQLGLSVTGMHLLGYELTAGTGAQRDDEGRVGPYINLWVARQF